jgi:hypothetical protein
MGFHQLLMVTSVTAYEQASDAARTGNHENGSSEASSALSLCSQRHTSQQYKPGTGVQTQGCHG